MQIIHIESTLPPQEFKFFCPVTGREITAESDTAESPATLGIWFSEVADMPMLYRPWIAEAWDKWVQALGEDDSLEVRNFLETLEDPGLVCFEFEFSGIACGPFWSTVWYLTDMNYSPDDDAN